MPNFESPALFIDFARLPPPQVIEEINYENLLSAYQAEVVAKNPALASAVKLEQSPTNVILEAEAYGEMLVRSRINAAARAVMLPFSTGTDLDVLGLLYGVVRATVPIDTSVIPNIPAHPESDTSLRRRIQLAAEGFATAGSAGGYVYHALTADPTIVDATAVNIGLGKVRVALMSGLSASPIPTSDQIAKVTQQILSDKIKPLTDMVSIVPVEKVETTIVATLTLYIGPDAALVMADVNKALTSLRNKVSKIGMDLTRPAIISALMQEGVQNVDLTSPAADIVIDSKQLAWITSATVSVALNRTE